MKDDYGMMRRTRPDGNCFFRAFAFAYFESLLNDDIELERFSQVATKTKNDLIKLGVLAFTVEDFHDNVSLFATILTAQLNQSYSVPTCIEPNPIKRSIDNATTSGRFQ